MALHKDFPQSLHAILDPGIRWFPADESLRESSMEKLMPPLVPMLRKKVKEFRDSGYAGAADTSQERLAHVRVHAHAGERPARTKYRTYPDFNHAYKKIKEEYSFLSCMVMEDQRSYKFFQGSA